MKRSKSANRQSMSTGDSSDTRPIDIQEEFGRFVREFGGKVVEDSLAPQQRDFSNADYVFERQNVVAELKVLTRDQSGDPVLYEKLQGLYLSAVAGGLVGPVFGTLSVNTKDFPELLQRQFLDAHKAPIATLIKKANKQIKATKHHLGMPDAKGLLILFNDGNFRLDHDVVAYLLHRVLGSDFSSINSIFYGTANLWSEAPWTTDLVTPLVTFTRSGLPPVEAAFLNELVQRWHMYVDTLRGSPSKFIEVAPTHEALSQMTLSRAKPGWQ